VARRAHPRDADTFGAKAANLGDLMRIGLPVPPGFAISAVAYLDAMREGGVRDELRAVLSGAEAHVDDDPRLFAASAERLRALVRKAGLPSALRDEVLGAYHRLGDQVPVAVRSSAPGEDNSAMSFAGMHDTLTNVIGATTPGVFDELYLVSGPRPDIGDEIGQTVVKVGRVGPAGRALPQTANEFTSQAGQREQQGGGDVILVERDHRRAACRRLGDQTSPDQILDDGTPVAGPDPGGGGKLPAGNGLLEPAIRPVTGDG
jgi:hypothetical protein